MFIFSSKKQMTSLKMQNWKLSKQKLLYPQTPTREVGMTKNLPRPKTNFIPPENKKIVKISEKQVNITKHFWFLSHKVFMKKEEKN